MTESVANYRRGSTGTVGAGLAWRPPDPAVLSRRLESHARQPRTTTHRYDVRLWLVKPVLRDWRAKVPEQPLSTFRKVRHVDFQLAWGGASPFREGERADLAVLCMEAIASWSHVEAAMLQLFISLLGNSQADAARMYLALDGRNPKTAAITAVASSRLSGERLEIFKAIMEAAASRQRRRDKLAHGIWGHSNELPEALLCVDARHLPLDFHPRGMADFLNHAARHSERIYVYRKGDFEEIVEENGKLVGAVFAFRTLGAYPEFLGPDPQYDRLCSIPEIANKVRRPA